MSDLQQFIGSMRAWWEQHGDAPPLYTGHLAPPFVRWGVGFVPELYSPPPPFSGRWKLRNGKVAEITVRHPNGGAEGVTEDTHETVTWDHDGNAVLMNREIQRRIIKEYDLMERIRDGAGQ